VGSPKIIDREVHEDIVIWLTRLQAGLAARNVVTKRRHVAPSWQVLSNIRLGVPQPSRPWGIFRRISGSMKEDVIDAHHKHQVGLRLHVFKWNFEMIAQPSKRLTRTQLVTRNVCCRRSEFADLNFCRAALAFGNAIQRFEPQLLQPASTEDFS